MGLTEGGVNMETNKLVDMLASVFSEGPIVWEGPHVWREQKEFDQREYLKANTLVNPKLSDDDLLTISKKDENGEYKAVFIRLGDLKDFLNVKPRKSRKSSKTS